MRSYLVYQTLNIIFSVAVSSSPVIEPEHVSFGKEMSKHGIIGQLKVDSIPTLFNSRVCLHLNGGVRSTVKV